MADAYVTSGSVSNDYVSYYIADRTLQLSNRRLILAGFATPYDIPQGQGKVMRIVRHRRVNLPFQQIDEYNTPDTVAITLEEWDIPVELWGLVIGMSRVSAMTVKHPLVQKAIQLGGMAMAEMIEREAAETCMSGTNVVFVDSANNNSRDDLAATDVVTSHVVLEALNVLRDHGAPDYGDGQYRGAFPIQVENDILDQDETFIGAAQFGDQRALEYAEVGRWMGVMWKRSNFLPHFTGVAAPTTAAATATKAQHDASGADGSTFSTANAYKLIVVGRDATTDYERRISQSSATIQDVNDSFTFTPPTSANYVYDVYMTNGAGASKLLASRMLSTETLLITAATFTAAPTATAPVAPASGVSTFNTFIFGQDAFVRVNLSGATLQSFVTPDGASDSDPLAQRKKVGWKLMMKFAVVDQNFMVRIESGSGFSANLPA